ncbi:hypothetical protein V502_08532 [Pseudogymnoascus sp. VKM F-4520 (FW-2644)]|nr:hypothetical protein V502_08532 [Pseudogymnoascus sp. VKM F-4520 (FW-2644)]
MLSPATLALLAGAPFALAAVKADAAGKLPTLGWNSWNAFSCNVDAEKVMTAANEVVNLGLKDAGYEYINIDDCWSIKDGRDETTHQIRPDLTKFPDGISGTADKIHALGLKIGIYSSAGTKTCAGYPASIGFEDVDAATFAAWGIDYLKYDNCYVPSNWTDPYEACVSEGTDPTLANGTCLVTNTTAPPDYDWSTSNTAERYRIMGDALKAQSRTILYSLCEWGHASVQHWGSSVAPTWRMSGDITAEWPRIMIHVNMNSFLMNYNDHWSHSDADMLEVGNGALTEEENRSHFALWAAMKSPLVIGTALDKLSEVNLAILKNKYLLAFNQDDVHGKPAAPYKWGVNPDWTFNATNPAEYWSGASSNGVLVLALNSLATTAKREIKWSEVPQLERGASYQVEDIWTGKKLGCVKDGISKNVVSHDTIGFLVGNKCGKPPGRW